MNVVKAFGGYIEKAARYMAATVTGQLGLGDMIPISVILLVVFVIIAIGAYILSGVANTLPANSQAQNVTNKGIGAFVQFSNFFNIIVIVIVAAIIIGLLLFLFMRGRSGGGGHVV